MVEPSKAKSVKRSEATHQKSSFLMRSFASRFKIRYGQLSEKEENKVRLKFITYKILSDVVFYSLSIESNIV
jgi:hypothetical protein